MPVDEGRPDSVSSGEVCHCDAALISLHSFGCPAVRITKGFQSLSVYITSILAGQFKGIVHQKMTILSFSHTQVVPV